MRFFSFPFDIPLLFNPSGVVFPPTAWQLQYGETSFPSATFTDGGSGNVSFSCLKQVVNDGITANNLFNVSDLGIPVLPNQIISLYLAGTADMLPQYPLNSTWTFYWSVTTLDASQGLRFLNLVLPCASPAQELYRLGAVDVILSNDSSSILWKASNIAPGQTSDYTVWDPDLDNKYMVTVYRAGTKQQLYSQPWQAPIYNTLLAPTGTLWLAGVPSGPNVANSTIMSPTIGYSPDWFIASDFSSA